MIDRQRRKKPIGHVKAAIVPPLVRVIGHVKVVIARLLARAIGRAKVVIDPLLARVTGHAKVNVDRMRDRMRDRKVDPKRDQTCVVPMGRGLKVRPVTVRFVVLLVVAKMRN